MRINGKCSVRKELTWRELDELESIVPIIDRLFSELRRVGSNVEWIEELAG